MSTLEVAFKVTAVYKAWKVTHNCQSLNKKIKRTTARLYVITLPRTCVRVNLHSIVAYRSRNPLLKTGKKSEV